MSAPTCGELSCDECSARTAELTAERDQLRARAELAEDNLAALEQSFDDNCRGVVRIADELATERARLDYLLKWDVTFNSRKDIDRDMQEAAK